MHGTINIKYIYEGLLFFWSISVQRNLLAKLYGFVTAPDWFGKSKVNFKINLSLCVRGSNSGGGEIFRTCPDRPCGPNSLPYNGYWGFPGGKERPGRDAYPSPPSSAVVKKE